MAKKKKNPKSCPAGKKLVKIKRGSVSFCASTRKKKKSSNKGNIAALKKGCRTMKAKGFTGKRKNLKAACAALGIR